MDFNLLTQEDLQRVAVVALLVFLNWLSASLGALANRNFSLKKFPEFVYTTFLPYVLGFAVLQILMKVGLSLSSLAGSFGNELSEQWAKAFDGLQLYGVFVAIVISVGTSAARNLAVLLGWTMARSQSLSK